MSATCFSFWGTYSDLLPGLRLRIPLEDFRLPGRLGYSPQMKISGAATARDGRFIYLKQGAIGAKVFFAVKMLYNSRFANTFSKFTLKLHPEPPYGRGQPSSVHPTRPRAGLGTLPQRSREMTFVTNKRISIDWRIRTIQPISVSC